MKSLQLLLCSLWLLSAKAWAYPNFIGYGYNTCLTCHYNPFGNGPLNDYGRAFSATALSDRVFYSKKTSEDHLVSYSGFFLKKPENNWFRPSLDYRGLVLKRNFREVNEETKFIHMQWDANIVMKFGAQDNFIMSLTFGYAPQPISKEDESDLKKYRSREHYIGLRFLKYFGFYVGMMDKVFGLRIPDHIAFSRQFNALDQNDQTHGFLGHFNNGRFNIGVHVFQGNLEQDSRLRQTGFSSKLEWTPTTKTNYGLSFLSSQSDFLKTNLAAVHAKWGFGKGSSLITEIGQGKKTSRASAATKTTHRYGFLQGHILLRRGFFYYTTVEYLKPNTSRDLSIVRWGPGLQYFPIQRVELRTDLYNSRQFLNSRVVVDTWDLAAQVHLWF